MPKPEDLDLAEVLLRKAESDLAAARTLATDAEQHDDAIGFHAQQAVEKSLKAALALAHAPVPRTHDLTFLVELLDANDVPVPDPVVVSRWLSPWAVTMRYDDLDDPLDRSAAIAAAVEALAWARGLLHR